MNYKSCSIPRNYSKRLGIYIPTQNRPNELSECIESFIPQLRPYKFPIYVYDTSKNDLIVERLKKLKSRYQYISFYHSDKSEVFSDASVKVLALGDTEYIWMFGDDDLLVPGAIDRIVKELDSGFEYLQINNQPFNFNFSEKASKPSIRCARDIVYKSGEHEKALLMASGGYAGYIAGLIIKRSRFETVFKKTKGTDRYFIPHILFFNAIVGTTGKLIASPLIKYRTGSQDLSPKAFEVWFNNYPRALRFLKPYYSERCLKAAERKDWLLIFLIQTKSRVLKLISLKRNNLYSV